MKIGYSRKVLALLITVALLVTQFAVTAFATECTGSHTFSNGICTVAGCGAYQEALDLYGLYQINNAGKLYWFAQQVNAGHTDYKACLTEDINLNTGYTFNSDGTYSNTTAPLSWTPIGSSSNNYEGSFYGRGHTVSGLYFNDDTATEVGLFGYIGTGGAISLVNLSNSYIKGDTVVGGICGRIHEGAIYNCSNFATVKGTDSVAGICGKVYPGSVFDCSNSGTIVGTGNYIAGIAGSMNSGTIDASFNTGSITGKGGVGGICGNTAYYSGATPCKINNCYNTGTITGTANNIGGICARNIGGTVENSYNYSTIVKGTGSDFGSVCGISDTGCVINSYYYPQNSITDKYATSKSAALFSNGTVANLLDENNDSRIWYQNLPESSNPDSSPVLDETHYAVYIKATSFDTNGFALSYSTASGYTNINSEYQPATDSNSDGYYELTNAGNLYWFAAFVNTGHPTCNAKLMNNIDLNPSYALTFLPDSGLVFASRSAFSFYLGTGIKGDTSGTNTLFDSTSSSNIKFYTAAAPTSILTEKPSDYHEWEPIGYNGVSFNGTFDGNGKTISKMCFISSGSGGLFGQIGKDGIAKSLTINNSQIFSGQNSGVVCGANGGNITGCTNNTNIYGTITLGGICAENSGNITDCKNTAKVIGSGIEVGGICGSSEYGSISNCSNTGAVTGTQEQVGGICGFNYDGKINNCYSSGTVEGNKYVGGINGANLATGEIKNCYNIGTVKSSNGFVGGICGSSGSSCIVSNCYYLEMCAHDGENATNYGIYYTVNAKGKTESKSTEQFNSGEVTYELNGGDNQVSPRVWFQTVNSGYPSFSGKTVYAGYENCGSETKSYSNSSTEFYSTLPEHTAGTSSNNGNGTHTAVCTVCSKSFTENHNYSSWIDNENGTHSRSCTACGNTLTDNHTLSAATNNNNGTHSGICTGCGADITESHTFSAWTDNNNGTHTRTCTACSYSQTGSHIVNSYDSCALCNYFLPAKLTTDVYDIDGDGEKDEVYEIKNVGQLYWYAEQMNSDVAYNVILMNDININPDYTFTFNFDTGLVTAAKNDGSIYYFGTGINGDASGSIDTFDSTASVSGQCYSVENDTEATIAPPVDLKYWAPISPNYGLKRNFDGNGKTVSGAFCNDSSLNGVGFFSHIENSGTVKNLTIANSYFNGKYRVAGICASNFGTIYGCSSSATVTGVNYVGGICGQNSNSNGITKCNNTGTIYGIYCIGGVCGYNENNSVTNCYSTGTVKGANYAGGICGNNSSSGTIANCYNTGAVIYNSDDGFDGAICGNSNGTVLNCYYLKGCAVNKNGNVRFGIGYTFPTKLGYDITGCTAPIEDFSDGYAAYRLNGSYTGEIWSPGVTDGTQAFYQDIDNGAAPYDTTPQFSGGTVHLVNGNYTNILHCLNAASDSTEINEMQKYVVTNNRTITDISGIVIPLTGFQLSATPSVVSPSISYYGTGTVINALSGTKTVEKFTLVVMGDTNGDSVCDVFDCTTTELASNNNLTLTGAKLTAVDFDEDGSIDSQDYQQIINRALTH